MGHCTVTTFSSNDSDMDGEFQTVGIIYRQ